MINLQVFALDGKTALVAGASRGIGLAIAKQVAMAGARTLLAARSIEELQKHAQALSDDGYQAQACQMDISSRESIDKAASELPDIDILINVSGTNIRKPFEEFSVSEYEHLMNTNLHGIVYLTQKVGARMVERKAGGKIIFVGSLMSLLGLPYLTVYGITKSALAGLTRTLAAEWGRHDIQVNCIAPGFIITDLNRHLWQADEMKRWLASAQANPETGKPEDIAPLALFLSSRGSDYVTGQVIAVDGGHTTTAYWPLPPPAK
jgi:NAD(P)-dependent dehydrogenase (short-subunit alcohol dehydrogenase family)